MNSLLRTTVLVLIAVACSDPAPAPITGMFAFTGQIDGRVVKSFVAGPSGVTEKYDTTLLNSPVSGAVEFDSLVSSVTSSVATLYLNQCQYCTTGGTGILGHALREGDSVKVIVGVTPTFQLLGVYRGDTIAGRIQDVNSFSGPNGNGVSTVWGTFVAKRVQPEPPVTFTLRGLFDSLTTTNGQGGSTTTAASDSIRGPLAIEALNIAPLAFFGAEKCGASCFGRTSATPAAFSGYTGAGRRNGDSVVVAMLWDLTSSFGIRGVYRGDSIVGEITSRRSTSTSTIYTGRFVARRNP